MQNLEALRTSKIWIPEGDQVGLTAFRALGITPILLPISDVFTGLQTGLIETVPSIPTSAIAFQWHSNTAYMTDLPITFLTGSLALVKSEFDKLKPEDQAILLEEMGAVFKRLDELNRIDNEAAMKALQQQGITIVSPSPGEAERWREIARQAVDDMVSSGVLSAQIVEQVRSDLQTFRAQQ
jgi:TRAP-type transport system periplasmic protein